MKRFSTSRDAVIQLLGVVESKICMKSLIDLILHLLGMYGWITLLTFLTIWYRGVGICEMMGRRGFPGLWRFIFP